MTKGFESEKAYRIQIMTEKGTSNIKDQLEFRLFQTIDLWIEDIIGPHLFQLPKEIID